MTRRLIYKVSGVWPESSRLSYDNHLIFSLSGHYHHRIKDELANLTAPPSSRYPPLTSLKNCHSLRTKKGQASITARKIWNAFQRYFVITKIFYAGFDQPRSRCNIKKQFTNHFTLIYCNTFHITIVELAFKNPFSLSRHIFI